MRSLRTVTFLVLLYLSLASQAAVTIVVEQVGNDVVATATGNANLTDLSVSSTFGSGNGAVAGELFSPGFIAAMAIGGGTADTFDIPITTNDFTSGDRFLGSASTGGLIGVAESTLSGPQTSILYLQQGYVSGSPISSSSRFSGVTIASMGLIPGTYVYPWGSANPDSLTITINSSSQLTSAIPALNWQGTSLLVALLAGLTYYRHRKIVVVKRT